ncbi:MobA/MobL family protein [Amedibacillus dolichus]|uniref:MobA/MobL family protein n=1 Tax=Amedibacillus dolichus TaxID=31971 RepID=A0ABT7UD50_9FIRM|nr:MobA/MobL family protein [Amedibacillus dolichus]MDM8157551.1 MobA/MobL family protein [Amedibacillus dolichus]
MTRHSFIQMSKLSNVRGRISYITSHAKQENLYATYRTADHSFWSNLARESQQEFQRSGAEGKCIEARELIIALPEAYTQYEPQQVLEDFTEEFRRRYDVECVSALHHNKRKTNYHIHLIFSERRLLAEPEVKIATRSVFFDETGKRVRTKKEITGEDGQIRKGCAVIPKGGIYEQHLFTVKDGRFKSEPFLEEVKRNYTALINRHIADPEQHLRVFNPDSIYLPTKKIGKNNPKAAEIEADNAARQEWNRTADMALVSGIAEAKILEVKKEEIHQKASQSIKAHGWLPNLFRSIVNKAKEFLQNLIRQTELPPKPVLNLDMSEFRTMQKLMIRVQDRAREIRSLQEEVPKLKTQLAETKGIFKGRERKELEVKIRRTEEKISAMLEELPEILKEDGYPDVWAFMATYRKVEAVVEQYNRDLAEWERTVREKRRPAEKERHAPPEKESVRDQLRRLQAEGRTQKPKRKTHDMER